MAIAAASPVDVAALRDSPRIATPTGLLAGESRDLSPVEKDALAAWMLDHAGDDDGRPWWPAAIRLLTLEERLRFAFDQEAAGAWRERERRRVERDVGYFTWYYGHLQPRRGSPIPFVPWPATDAAGAIGARSQEDVLELLRTALRLLVLKARQLGMTWLVLHHAYHLQAFDPDTPNAKILGLSKHGEDATKLLQKARRIHMLKPPFLRLAEDPQTRGSLSRFKIAGRGELVSLTGNPAAARQETATMAILDEYGFIKNGQAGATSTAVEPTVGDDGQIVKLSTGNGRTGDGAALAADWTKAIGEQSNYVAVFIPASADPTRTPDWRAGKVGDYRSEEDFLQEHPETAEQALGGEGTVRIYPDAHLAAARKLGAALAEHEDGGYFELLVSTEGIEWGVDWGDFQTFTVYATTLPDLGIYVVDELVQGHVEPGEASDAILDHRPAGIPSARFIASRADSAPAGTNRTFAKALEIRRTEQPQRYPEQHVKVPFGVYKEGGGDRRRGVNTVGFLRNRLRQAAEWTERPGWRDRLEELRGVVAIHPRCKTLLAQMANLERDPRTGKVKKPDLDPRDLERGDHGPDALVALAYKRAEVWTTAAVETEDDI